MCSFLLKINHTVTVTLTRLDNETAYYREHKAVPSLRDCAMLLFVDGIKQSSEVLFGNYVGQSLIEIGDEAKKEKYNLKL